METTSRIAAITALACICLSGTAPVLAAPYANVDTSSFTTLQQNTPTPVNLLGTGDATITRTSAVGSPIFVDTWAGTFSTPVNGRSNPDWVLGTRSYFDLSVPSPGSVGSTVSYEFLFANGLDTNAQLVFIDFDALERVTIKAYDSFSNLIAFGATSLLLSPGADTSPRYQDISWLASAGATGLLSNVFDDSESNIIASINSSVAIHRLVYDFDFSQVTNTATIRFQIAAPVPAPVPPAIAIFAMGLLATVGLRRRRRTA